MMSQLRNSSTKPSVLFMFHCSDDAGFAISKLRQVFHKAALHAGISEEHILFSYKNVSVSQNNKYQIDYELTSNLENLQQLVKKHNVRTVLAFDLNFPSPIAATLRNSGVSNIVSYWGASISGLQPWWKLILKRVDWILRKRYAADHFIFESEAMRLTATHGRGIPRKHTSVIHLGVDTNTYLPVNGKKSLLAEFGITDSDIVVFYSGHFEERKGVRTIVKAANELALRGNIDGIYFLLCGNRGNEANTYKRELTHDKARQRVIFAGYRDDVPHLMRNSDIGVIASTGWDSFTRSSVEMLSSGLPLIVSKLGGLPESTKHGVTGFHITPGNYTELANRILELKNSNELRSNFARNARSLVQEQFTEQKQINAIAELIQVSK